MPEVETVDKPIETTTPPVTVIEPEPVETEEPDLRAPEPVDFTPETKKEEKLPAETGETVAEDWSILKFKADGKEEVFEFGVDETTGALTKETLDTIRDTFSLAKGIKSKYDKEVESHRRTRTELQASQNKVQDFEAKHVDTVGPNAEFEPYIKLLQTNPAVRADMDKTYGARLREHGWKGPVEYDPKTVEISRREQAVKQQEYGIATKTADDQVAKRFIDKYPDFATSPEWTEFVTEVANSDLMEYIPNIPLDKQVERVFRLVEGHYLDGLYSGKYADPRQRKAQAELDDANKRLEEAKKIAEVRNPTASSTGASPSATSGKVEEERFTGKNDLGLMHERLQKARQQGQL